MIFATLKKAVLPVLIGGALLVFMLALLWVILVKFDGMLERAARTAAEARDSYWTGQIERSNAEVNRQLADQAKAALAIEADANARVRAVEIQIANLEVENAALPGGDDCGLRRDRVRVLPN